MRARLASLILVFAVWAAPRPALAQAEYGAKGMFPIYDIDGRWIIYDKTFVKGGTKSLRPKTKFLVIGSSGADLFAVERSSQSYGGLCRERRPAAMRAAIIGGSRRSIGDPILAIKAPQGFSLRGSRAAYRALPNAVGEGAYRALGATLAAATFAEVKSGAFRFKPDDAGAAGFAADPALEKILLKIDYAAKVDVSGLADATVLVTGAQISNSFRRCLRLADGDKLIGDCVEMPGDLMAETAQLKFVSYDASGKGGPLLLVYTKEAPMWGHERWGFALRSSGPRLLLRDAMDPRCRAGF